MLENEAKDDGFAFSATSDDVDRSKLPRGLILIGNQGVYLMSQAPRSEVDVAGVSHMAYARQIDPTTLPFDEWYDAKREAFGGDDGTMLLPQEDLEQLLSHGGETIDMDLTPDHLSFYEPAS